MGWTENGDVGGVGVGRSEKRGGKMLQGKNRKGRHSKKNGGRNAWTKIPAGIEKHCAEKMYKHIHWEDINNGQHHGADNGQIN